MLLDIYAGDFGTLLRNTRWIWSGKYPHGYLVRNTITPGGHTIWARGFWAYPEKTAADSSRPTAIPFKRDAITLQPLVSGV
jgi:hypothetical protein